MKTFKKIAWVGAMLLAQTTLAGINNECVNNPNSAKKDCPNDPYNIFAYEYDYMNFAYAWDKSYGTARVGIFEVGIHPGMLENSEFNSKIRFSDSGFFRCGSPSDCSTNINDFNFVKYFTASQGTQHGDFIVSLLGAKANNGIGASSVCRECSLSYARGRTEQAFAGSLPNTFDYINYSIFLDKFNKSNLLAYRALVHQGNQIINHSGGLGHFGYTRYPNCDIQASNGREQLFCNTLRLAKARDVVILASMGNDKSGGANWPANEPDLVIGVGGSDSNGRIWDELNDNGLCPSGYPNNLQGDQLECGSQFEGVKPIMAPAQEILVYHDGPFVGCDIANIPNASSNYLKCNGTSFSAPIITGIVSIIRSLNPLISVDEIRDILWESNPIIDHLNRAYSIPNINKILKHDVLGFSDGQKIANRVKPMFRLEYTQNIDGTLQKGYLSTSVPQVAVSALTGKFLGHVNVQFGTTDNSIFYSQDTTEPLALGYTKFRGSAGGDNARAPFYIFGGHENPFTGNDDMVPLYHMGYREAIGYTSYNGCENIADHAYSTTLTNRFLIDGSVKCPSSSNKFEYEGIQGYLFQSCPTSGQCFETTNDPESAQCLKLRYSSKRDNYALLMQSELEIEPLKTKFADYSTIVSHYTGMSNSECLGYVFPNVDSDNDLIIDGMELVLGTNPLDNDSDDDNKLDGEEYPPASSYVSDPLIDD